MRQLPKLMYRGLAAPAIAASVLAAMTGCTADSATAVPGSAAASPSWETPAAPEIDRDRWAAAQQALGAADPRLLAFYPADLQRMLDDVCTDHDQHLDGDPAATLLARKYPEKIDRAQADILTSVALTKPGYCR